MGKKKYRYEKESERGKVWRKKKREGARSDKKKPGRCRVEQGTETQVKEKRRKKEKTYG